MFSAKTESLFLFLTASLLFISCSGKPPVLGEVWWHLNVEKTPGEEQTVQSLSLFVHATDDDGDKDLEDLYLINDGERLYWEIPSEQWVRYTEQSTDWIGFNGLRAPGDGRFPDGNYRVLLIDAGGERDEKNLFVKNSIPRDKDIPIPDFAFDSAYLTLTGEYPIYQVWFYNDKGELVDKSRNITPGRYQWNELVRNITRRSVEFTVYGEPQSGAWGLISGPYSFSD